ncbi:MULTISPECIES: phosphoribosylglycinamide formyltransferase [unclassified Sphingomonas]|jgi:formyltetrahydrofolate-dependent phosphoribosylglycinamide formyltransferase|uniref:phosphoribosylglycinamide formyltransferase n=1 Tax=unclassified Sphingomonas TaxID=196159 RepID=UPI00082E6AFD|nr:MULTISPECIES: phosphoribosylglycinamide formyltransferase [unclassified Sphingomonas]
MADRARLGVLISGRGSNMAALLYASRAADCPFALALVASNDPDAAGLTLAAAEGIATFALSHRGMARADFDARIDAALREAGVTHVALAGYMRLLSPEFVERWAGRMVNIHPSLLPAYKGLHTHERALAAGDSHGGCSVHLVTAELDDGPVLGQTEVAILPGDTPETLAARVLIAEHQLYPRIVADWIRAGQPADDPLAKVRERALALPEAREKLSHGAPGFFVEGGKFFAYFSADHHGNGITAVLVRTSGVEEQAMLIERDPALYYRPPYLGPSGWIGVRLDTGDTDWAHVGEWLARSWRLAAPKRLTRLMDVADAF